MGMTWKLNVIRIVFVLAVVVALAMALSANFADAMTDDSLLAL
jgi:hypothetical protein